MRQGNDLLCQCVHISYPFNSLAPLFFTVYCSVTLRAKDVWTVPVEFYVRGDSVKMEMDQVNKNSPQATGEDKHCDVR